MFFRKTKLFFSRIRQSFVFRIILVAFIVGFGIVYVSYALNPPTGNPPSEAGRVISAESGAPSNTIFINNGGNVGIGTTNPGAKLSFGIGSLQTFPDNDLAHINWYNGGSAEGYRRYLDIVAAGYEDGAQGGGAIRFFTTNVGENTATEKVRIDRTGNVGIGTTGPTYRLHVNGTFYASGSSQDFKTNIRPLEIDSSKIYQLEPVSFDYKEQYRHFGKILAGGRQFGLIAEEVYKVYPELTLSDGVIKTANVDYEKLSVLLLNELKKHQKIIEQLKAENKKIEERLNDLNARLLILEK